MTNQASQMTSKIYLASEEPPPCDPLESLKAFSVFGDKISTLAFPGIAARFEQPKSLLSELEWSSDCAIVRASVNPSQGGEPYEVCAAVHLGPWRRPKGQFQGEALYEFWTSETWRGFGRCSCPFAEADERICKHLGALVETAGAIAIIHAERLELERSTPSAPLDNEEVPSRTKMRL